MRQLQRCMSCRRRFQVPLYGASVECAVCIAGGVENERATRGAAIRCAVRWRNELPQRIADLRRLAEGGEG